MASIKQTNDPEDITSSYGLNRTSLASSLKLPPPIGQRIPDIPHAISVSLPTWQATEDFAVKKEEFLAKMQSWYPRLGPGKDLQLVLGPSFFFPILSILHGS